MHLSTLKDCPQCHNLKLIPVEAHGQVVDVCEKCHGTWFEAGELEGAWKEAHGALPPGRALLEDKHSAWSAPLPEADNPRICPDCEKKLHHHYLSEEFKVELIRCAECEGVWVEEKHRCAVHYSPKVRAALSEIVKPLNWGTFIFQNLTRMPAEFNMKPRKTPWVNRFLIALNLLIFLIVILEPDFFAVGGLVPDALSRGEGLLTLITYQFQHGNFVHIFGNMFFLYLMGDSIEDMIGHYYYLALYLCAGIFAGLTQWAFDLNSTIAVIGASGSISALFGVYLLWFRRAKLTFMIIFYQLKLAPWIFFLLWTLYQFIGIATMDVGVAYAAHLGGFFFGLFVGVLTYKKVLEKNPVLAHINGPMVNLADTKGNKFYPFKRK